VLQLFTATPKKSTALPTFVRFLQGLLALGIIAAIACLIAFTDFTIADLFASALAFLATGWCLLCVSTTFSSFSFPTLPVLSAFGVPHAS
jgi:callose synthase